MKFLADKENRQTASLAEVTNRKFKAGSVRISSPSGNGNESPPRQRTTPRCRLVDSAATFSTHTRTPTPTHTHTHTHSGHRYRVIASFVDESTGVTAAGGGLSAVHNAVLHTRRNRKCSPPKKVDVRQCGAAAVLYGRGLLQSNLLPYCAAALHLDNTIQRVDNDVTESGRDS